MDEKMEAWLIENGLSSLLGRPKFVVHVIEQEANIDDILDLNDKELELIYIFVTYTSK